MAFVDTRKNPYNGIGRRLSDWRLNPIGQKPPPKRSSDYVDPPEVLRLQALYIARRKARGKPIPPGFAALLLGIARNVYARPWQFNRGFTQSMICIKANYRRDPEEHRTTALYAGKCGRRKLRLLAEKRALEKAKQTNPLAVSERVKSPGRYLPI